MKNVLLLTSLFFLSFLVKAQIPQGFSYQAVIRNGSGTPIVDQFVGVEITLQNTSGTALYTETHRPRTNAQGVISITIGEGTLVGTNTFASIPWKTGDVLVKVRIDPAGGIAYAQIGEPTELKSVPYALYTNPKEITSAPGADPNSPIFEVKNNLGQVVFGVYQGGVRVYVDDAPVKGAKGGFAVGGLSQTKAGDQPFFFKITPDSARIYFNDSDTPKGAKGGFAVGGRSQTKAGISSEYLRITPDSARIYIDNTTPKGAKGGFAVGGRSQTKGAANNYLQLTPENYFIGQDAGKSMTTGLYNSFIGYQSGYKNSAGYKNYFIGYRSGYNNLSGYSNIFIGDSAGFVNSSGSHNVFIGNQGGSKNTTGHFNVATGYRALFSNTEGNANAAYGENSLYSNTTGANNTASGLMSMFSNTTANGNTAMGYQALYSNTTGVGNTALGAWALLQTPNAIFNTAIGFNALSTLFNVGNSTAIGANAQVTGSNQVRIGDATIQWIGGQVGWSTVSDGRFKNIVKDEVKGLDFINRLSPVIYNFDTQKYDEFLMKNASKGLINEPAYKRDFSKSKSIKRSGFVAQDVEKAAEESGFVFNGVHHPENENDNYSIDYSLLTVPLVKAVQELNAKNDDLQKQVEALKAELESIKALLKK